MVYLTMASLPYAVLLSWTMLPGMLFLWVLIPWMILCLSFSSYLLRPKASFRPHSVRQPAMEQLYDSEEDRSSTV